MEQKQILIDRKILHYYRSRNSENSGVLVFLHGWMQDGTSFRDIFTILEKNSIPYVSLDFPGFWKSGLYSENMNISDYTRITEHFIEKLWLIKPILVWHSFWGRICVSLGSYYTNISQIVLIWAAWVQRWISSYKKAVIKSWKMLLSIPWLAKVEALIKNKVSSADLKSAWKLETVFRNVIAEDLQDKMKQVKYPTLMIWGKDDDQTPVSDAQIIHSHIQNSQLHILEWTHFVHQEQAEKVSKLILDFIAA